jgi:hypothetical protein
MDSTDRIVLVAGPGPEVLAAILLIAVGLAGFAVTVFLLRRGRAEAWPLTGLFGLLSLFSFALLWHLPTRLSVDRNGVDVRLWFLSGHRDWKDVQVFGVTRNSLGLWIVVSQRSQAGALPISVWAPRLGFFVANSPVEPGRLVDQVATWRVNATPP